MLALVIAACSDPSSVQNDGVVQVRAYARGLAQPLTSAGPEIESLEIDRVLVVVGRIKLETAGDGTTDFVDDRSIVIELANGVDAVLAIAANIPDGNYKELEIAVDKLERGHATEQQLIHAHPGLDNASILIEGVVTRSGGSPERFMFASDLDIDLEITFQTSLSVGGPDAQVALVALVLDIGSWFRSQAGELLDPTRSANRSAIEGAIQKSIELFEDPDRNGHK